VLQISGELAAHPKSVQPIRARRGSWRFSPATAVTVLPSLGGAPTTQLTRLMRVTAVEVLNYFLGVLNVVSWYFSRLVISSPLHGIL